MPMARRRQAEIAGRIVRMMPGTHRLLEALLIRGPKWTLHDELIEILWPDPNFEPDCARKVIDQGIVRLRKAGVEITTFHGVGYRLRQPGDLHYCGRKPPRPKEPRKLATRFPVNPPGWILGQPL
jgi:DNA-binding response OmpR family regulator